MSLRVGVFADCSQQVYMFCKYCIYSIPDFSTATLTGTGKSSLSQGDCLGLRMIFENKYFCLFLWLLLSIILVLQRNISSTHPLLLGKNPISIPREPEMTVVPAHVVLVLVLQRKIPRAPPPLLDKSPNSTTGKIGMTVVPAHVVRVEEGDAAIPNLHVAQDTLAGVQNKQTKMDHE